MPDVSVTTGDQAVAVATEVLSENVTPEQIVAYIDQYLDRVVRRAVKAAWPQITDYIDRKVGEAMAEHRVNGSNRRETRTDREAIESIVDDYMSGSDYVSADWVRDEINTEVHRAVRELEIPDDDHIRSIADAAVGDAEISISPG